ncbi:helix-turn-helix transcriptional regulator [Mycoplasmatota bacterium]|nr:helix-turn-helix transcriptional regulator [Mycoplasmatota bacterium]
MNKEFKLSILEMTILLLTAQGEIYGYDIAQNIYNLLSLEEGITYPVVKKLTNEGLLQVNNEIIENLGTRKFYHITKDGIIKLKKDTSIYLDISDKIYQLMKGLELNE